MKYIVAKVEDWDKVANALAQDLAPGSVLALSGPLGAGKTTFVQALARTLGAKVNPRSPTFSLVRTYPLKGHPTLSQLIHVDAYRIEDPKNLLPLGLDELLAEPGSVMALEWPEHADVWLRRVQGAVLRMTIEADPSGVRRVDVR